QGGQISILSNSGSTFTIGSASQPANGTTGVISTNAGLGGQNGGSVYITNLGAGGISLPNTANLTANGGAATPVSSGGTGGSVYLNAPAAGQVAGAGGKVYIGGSFNVNGGISLGVSNQAGVSPGGTGGIIAITVNTTSTVFNLGGASSGCQSNC